MGSLASLRKDAVADATTRKQELGVARRLAQLSPQRADRLLDGVLLDGVGCIRSRKAQCQLRCAEVDVWRAQQRGKQRVLARGQ